MDNRTKQLILSRLSQEDRGRMNDFYNIFLIALTISLKIQHHPVTVSKNSHAKSGALFPLTSPDDCHIFLLRLTAREVFPTIITSLYNSVLNVIEASSILSIIRWHFFHAIFHHISYMQIRVSC